MPMSTATRQATSAPISTVHGNAIGRSAPSSDAHLAPADVDRQPAGERGGGERGDAGEAPSGRARADRPTR